METGYRRLNSTGVWDPSVVYPLRTPTPLQGRIARSSHSTATSGDPASPTEPGSIPRRLPWLPGVRCAVAEISRKSDRMRPLLCRRRFVGVRVGAELGAMKQTTPAGCRGRKGFRFCWFLVGYFGPTAATYCCGYYMASRRGVEPLSSPESGEIRTPDPHNPIVSTAGRSAPRIISHCGGRPIISHCICFSYPYFVILWYLELVAFQNRPNLVPMVPIFSRNQPARPPQCHEKGSLRRRFNT